VSDFVNDLRQVGQIVFSFFLLLILLSVGSSNSLAASSPVVDSTTCAAYFFNATKVSPAKEYEKLFQLGVKSADRARSSLGSEAVMRRIGDASDIMMELIERDFRRFNEIEELYGSVCSHLMSPEELTK
jgi:hypothetical protein